MQSCFSRMVSGSSVAINKRKCGFYSPVAFLVMEIAVMKQYTH